MKTYFRSIALIFRPFFSTFLRHALDGLEQNLHRINEDLQTKTNSLRLDEQCLASRQKLEPTRPQTVNERNMELTGMSREKSKILC